eukprot:CAMPEP_0184130088 /NCGR_PEP_ID=MMETSP0974-20121125/27419_1 /TAXON_ID=483370 /ORGANISM="non described non described, Strain CCMP2097" /LENGTH=40 /DNA_ID= /DNA_START= /DNA_END= /DNA_ORIENTATION=
MEKAWGKARDELVEERVELRCELRNAAEAPWTTSRVSKAS